MLSKIFRVIKTLIIKIKNQGKVRTEDFPDFYHDTKLKVKDNGEIILGRNISTFNNVHLSAIGGKMKIGDRVSFNRNCIVLCRESISIGDECIFGPNVCVYDHDHVYGYDGIQKGYKTSPIVIESNCWIGANVVILRGTHIGKDSVVGAGAVVRGSIPAHSIVTNDRKLIITPIEANR